MRMVPSSLSFCPASARMRCLAAAGRLVFRGRRNRSCTALDTLFTFWPPGPDARMNFHSSSSSGMTMCGVISMATGNGARLIETRRRGAHKYFALCQRNGDLVFLEQPPYGPIHLRADVVDAFLRIRNPKSKFEFYAAVAELHQARHRRGVGEDPRLSLARGEQNLERELRIVGIADADRQLQADPR